MGLAALTRKGWMTNPRKQGRWNFFASIFAIVFGTLYIWIFELDCCRSFRWMLSIQFIGIMSIFLLWGVISLVGGMLLGGSTGKKKAT